MADNNDFSWMDSLNENQSKAVSLGAGSSLILAGAGSGKTKVLTSRIAYLIQRNEAKPWGILAVTFTNKAAREMVERLGKAGVDTKGMWVGTFHGLCNRILRRFHAAAELPASFHILDDDDSKQLLKRLYKANEWSEDYISVKEGHARIMAEKEAGRRSHKFEPKNGKDFSFKEIFVAYEEQLKKEGAVDFPELLLKTVELLADVENVRKWARDSFSHVLIDEFQDTNNTQYRWLRLMTEMQTPVFAVGDDDQSIYAFRGAKVENMRKYLSDFNVGETVRLEQNYRSHGIILKAANALIEKNTGRLGKNLWTSQGDGEKITLKENETEMDEAGFIARESRRHRDAGRSLKEVGVLYRTNAQARALEQAMLRNGLPYVIYGGMRFYEKAEVKDAMSYLSLCANKANDSAFFRAVNFPARGIGAKTLQRLAEIAKKDKVSAWDAVDSLDAGDKATKALQGFKKLITGFSEASATQSVALLIKRVVEESGLLAEYSQKEEDKERVENLKELANAANNFMMDSVSEDKSLEGFLAQATLEPGERGAKRGDEAVQMMTVHSAKGLEFDNVYIAGLEEGLFPHSNSAARKEDLEEERRLMYVAMTRAREFLTITIAKNRSVYGKTESKSPSMFLNEIPRQFLKVEDSDPVYSGYANRSSHSGSGGHRQSQRGAGVGRQAPSDDYSQEANINSPYPKGCTIRHPKFGLGVVKSTSAYDDDLDVVIDFESVGRKTLRASYVKLEVVSKQGGLKP